MDEKGQITSIDKDIQALLGGYLNAYSLNEPRGNTPHLDEDTFSVFAEGNLSEREAQPIVSHLVDCSFCRHVTADLVRLDMAFAEVEPLPVVAQAAEPSKVSEVLSGLLSRIFGSSGAAVFAHEDPKKEEEKAEEGEKEEEK